MVENSILTTSASEANPAAALSNLITPRSHQTRSKIVSSRKI